MQQFEICICVIRIVLSIEIYCSDVQIVSHFCVALQKVLAVLSSTKTISDYYSFICGVADAGKVLKMIASWEGFQKLMLRNAIFNYLPP